MRVIRTDVRRRILRSTAAASASLAVLASVIVSVSVLSGSGLTTVASAVRSYDVPNANEYDAVLYYPEVRPEVASAEEIPYEPVQTEKAVVVDVPDETQLFSGKYLITVNRSSDTEDLSLFSAHSGDISTETFGKGNGPEFISLSGGAQLRNCTDIPDEVVEYECSSAVPPAIELYSDKPQVLILHTHTTESYEPYIKDWYDESYTSRSSDPSNGVVAVGDAIAEQLAAAGICVIHDCTIHDGVYTGAYVRSLSTAMDIMDRYPSIKIVLDIHRDAIEYEDGTRVSAVTEIDGKKAAQVMIICAADDGTYGVPDFLENLHFAGVLQQSMESMYPTLTRPVLFQYCQYNQQVSTGALLIEVGSHGNSVDQAVYSGELIGRSLAALLTENAMKTEAVPVSSNVPFFFIDRVI